MENIPDWIKRYWRGLLHHGVKGQKWGVVNGSPYPIDRSGKSDTIVRDSIASGEVSKTITEKNK